MAGHFFVHNRYQQQPGFAANPYLAAAGAFVTSLIPQSNPFNQRISRSKTSAALALPRFTQIQEIEPDNKKLLLKTIHGEEMATTHHTDQRNVDANALVYTAFNNAKITAKVTCTAAGTPTNQNLYGFAGVESYVFTARQVVDPGSSFPSQQQHLLHLFNLYQEYRLKKVGFEFKPAAIDPVTDSTGFYYPLSGTGPDWRPRISALAALPWDMVAIHDHNDAFAITAGNNPTSNQALVEAWGMEELSGAVRWNSSQFVTHSFDLNAFANVNTRQGAPDFNSSSGINSFRPIEAPWLPTKVYDVNASATRLNVNPVMSCVKIGFYSNILATMNEDSTWYPVTTGSSTINCTLGAITWTYVFEFRMREFRQPVTTLGDAPKDSQGFMLTEEGLLRPLSKTSLLIPDPEKKEENDPPSKKLKIDSNT